MNYQTLQGIPESARPGHWMSRMLSPDSVAIIGASEKAGSFGQSVLELLQSNNFPGEVYLVNPRYQSISGQLCYPDIASLPKSPDLVVMVTGNKTMDMLVRDAVCVNVGGIVIFANNYLEGDIEPFLLDRLKEITRAAGIPVCGGNGMGFYNYASRTLVSFDFPPKRSAGHISLVAHSGSVMTYLTNTDPRLMYNLAVSPGQEINGTVADYMLYALDQPSTRVIAVFVETVRDPEKFVEALASARLKQIPVVVVKVGATEKSARMAVSHSGAVAGNDSAFQAVCDHYGAIRVRDMDELAATALVMSMDKRPGPGKLSSVLDSGGLREQMIDLSESCGVEFTELTARSKKKLGTVLEHGLIAENPVDAMGAVNIDVKPVYRDCLEILNDDPGTSMLSLEFEFRDHFSQYPGLLEVAKQSAATLDKPLVVICSAIYTANSVDSLDLGEHGIPVINGISLALTAIGKAFWYRDHEMYPSILDTDDCGFDEALVQRWQGILAKTDSLDEVDSLNLLRDFGLPSVNFVVAKNIADVDAAADRLEFPLVLKSAQQGLLHKSDSDGVKINLKTREQLEACYQEMSDRLGPRVVIAPMISDGVELGFGMINDDQFGPMVMVCAGWVYIELLDDRRFIPVPCSAEEARHNIESLAIFKILKGARGRAPCRVDLAAKALSDFSRVASALGSAVSGIDLNPVIVTPETCVIVDALIVSGNRV